MLLERCALQTSSIGALLCGCLRCNELLVSQLESADLSGQGKGPLLMIGVEDVLQHFGVKIGAQITVTLLDGCLDSLGLISIC